MAAPPWTINPTADPSYLGFSKEPDKIAANTSLGSAIGNFGSVVTDAFAAADYVIFDAAKERLRPEIEQLQDKYGANIPPDQIIPVAGQGVKTKTAAAGDTDIVDEGNIPAEGTPLRGNLDKVLQYFDASRRGERSSPHYALEAHSRLRKIRADFPGYEDRIDAFIQSKIGFDPANKSVTEVRNAFENLVRGQQSQEKAAFTLWQKYAQEIYGQGGDGSYEAFKRNPTLFIESAEVSKGQSIQRARVKEEEVSAAHTDADKARVEIKHVRTNTANWLTAFNQNNQKPIDDIQRLLAQPGGIANLPQSQVEAIQNQIAALQRAALLGANAQVLGRGQPKFADAETVQKELASVITSFYKPFADAVGVKDTNMITLLASQATNRANRAQDEFVRGSPPAQVLQTLVGIDKSGLIAADLIRGYHQKLQSDVATSITKAQAQSNLLTSAATASNLLTEQDPKRQIVLPKFLQMRTNDGARKANTTDVLDYTKVLSSTLSAAAPGDGTSAKVFSLLADREYIATVIANPKLNAKVYSELATSRFLDAAKKADADVQQQFPGAAGPLVMYRTTMEKLTTVLFRSQISEEANNAWVRTSKIELAIDPATGLFTTVAKPKERMPMEQGRGEHAFADNFVKDKAARINSILSPLTNIYSAQKLPAADEMIKFLAASGVQLQSLKPKSGEDDFVPSSKFAPENLNAPRIPEAFKELGLDTVPRRPVKTEVYGRGLWPDPFNTRNPNKSQDKAPAAPKLEFNPRDPVQRMQLRIDDLKKKLKDHKDPTLFETLKALERDMQDPEGATADWEIDEGLKQLMDEGKNA